MAGATKTGEWDAVVIGSGAGGLSAAAALARAGQRVLVLEQHYLPGGWMHSFSLEGFRFSPGVHYIGELGPGGSVRRLFEGLGLSPHLAWNELDADGYEHVLVGGWGGERFDFPKGLDRLIARLVARFPDEREGIARYFSTARGLCEDIERLERGLGFPAVLALPIRAPRLARWGLSTLSELLDRTIRDPLLRAILSAQCGDSGLPPSRVSLAVHARVIAHYYDGGYYPRGGGKAIAAALLRVLRARGGAIRLRTRVERILVEKDRAVGVRLAGGETIRARRVISNADPAVTYGRLLPTGAAPRQARRASRMGYSASLLSVFAATDLDLAHLGYDSGNYWWFRHADVERIYDDMTRGLPGDTVDGLFLTITTLKDPGHRRDRLHTLEMFTFAPWEPFSRWAGAPSGERGASYVLLKQQLLDKVLSAAEEVIPGLGERLVFRAMGTPVTNDFYCETVRGAAYGTDKTPGQVGPFSFGIEGPLRNLYLCGASTIAHGVVTAAVSGLHVARAILGAKSLDDILAPADGSTRVYPSGEGASEPEVEGEEELDEASALTP